MSVYHEAQLSGRLTAADIRQAGGGSPRRALQAVKRREAEARNARTPHMRRRAWRRQLRTELGGWVARSYLDAGGLS